MMVGRERLLSAHDLYCSALLQTNRTLGSSSKISQGHAGIKCSFEVAAGRGAQRCKDSRSTGDASKRRCSYSRRAGMNLALNQELYSAVNST